MRPTVITDVLDDSRLMQEEIFGPVTCILPFKTEEEVCGSGGRGSICMLYLVHIITLDDGPIPTGDRES